MRTLLLITGYTMLDQVRQKSFLVLFGIAVLLVLMIRGCYGGNYVVNGQTVESAELAWNVSKIVFQVVIVFMYLVAALLAMKLYRRDVEDGSAVLFLSRPVARWEYLLGRVFGTWLLAAAFMFALHLTIFITAWLKTGGVTPEFLAASLLTSVNLLFVVLTVFLLSLFLPDIMAALFTIGIVIIGFVSDGGYQLMNNEVVKSVISPDAPVHMPLWRILYPKLFMVQGYADSVISSAPFTTLGPVHPLLNVGLWVAVIVAVSVLVFNRKDI